MQGAQHKLAFDAPPRADNSKAKRKRDYNVDNDCAARVILADEAKYGGEAALPVQWARRIVERSA